VLREAGFSETEVEALARSGATIDAGTKAEAAE
jgi:hypothetical protein